MEKNVQIFSSHAEAEAEDDAFYRSLTGSQRLEILWKLIHPDESNAIERRLKRVYRITQLGEG
jgi:hypothetical protein